jgi:GTP 3',8-cyclase
MADDYRIDSHKLIYHPERVARWLQAGNDWEKAKKVYPIYLEVSPSGACNHRCTFCALDYIGYKPRLLDMEVMRRVLPEMGSLGVKSIMFAGEGEPLLHKQIVELAGLAVESTIDISFTTNGVLLSPRIAEKLLPITQWIKVSIDAGTPETYSALHQTQEKDFHRVISNLKHSVKYRNDARLSCTLGGQVLLLPENYRELRTLAKICRDDIGLDYLVIKTHSQHAYSLSRKYASLSYKELDEAAEAVTDLSSGTFSVIYRAELVRNHINNGKSPKTCHAVPFFWAYMMSNHDIYSCSAYLQDPRFLLGNLKEQSFKEIWEGQSRESNFLYMQNGHDTTQCRINCRMNPVNRYLLELMNPVPHVNFI